MIVRTGKDRGKEGTVLRSFPKKRMVLVEGIHLVHRHQRSTKRGSQGQIVEKPMPMPAANVSLKDAKSGKPIRIGYRVEGEGASAKKIRIARPSGDKI